MQKIKNYHYRVIGCFNTPEQNITICGDDDEFSNDLSFHNIDYDMDILVGSEENINEIYNKLSHLFSIHVIEKVAVCGFFKNGNNSVLFVGDNYGNKFLEKIRVFDYISIKNCKSDYIKENLKGLYDMIKYSLK
jgi:hypothetical protein